jgi:uncharacterized protein (DUF885 family)
MRSRSGSRFLPPQDDTDRADGADAVRATAAPAFTGWLDAFFEACYRRRPVNATFVGVHAYDDRLPDLSEAGLGDMAAEGERLLARLRALPPEELTAAEGIDRQLAEGFLQIQAWEASSAQFAWGNPSLHTGEAIFGVLGLLLRPFAPLAERLDLTVARLEAIPRFLDDGRAVLHDAPSAWCARARRECAGAALLLGDGLDRLLHDEQIIHHGLRPAADNALQAFARFDAFIQTDLLPRAIQPYPCGGETFDLLLRRGHFLSGGADELEQLALARMAEEESALASGEPSPDAAPQAPTPYLQRFSELWRTAVDAAEAQDVLTGPDWPVRYVEQPAWVRDAAPCLYFLPYRAPAPFDATPVVDYFVPPMADDSTIKLNHVIHHGSLGHHVQNWHAARAPSRIGQMAAVDCAARIAMLCGGTLAEGWACYATDLAEELGLLTDAERFAQHTARLRMAARAVVDIRLHLGRMSLQQAADFYEQRVGMTAAAAHAEALKNSLFPGAACMYLAGWDGIWRLRREFTQQHHFSLRQFHEEFLSFGSVPVSLVGQTMRAANGVGVASTVLAKR